MSTSGLRTRVRASVAVFAASVFVLSSFMFSATFAHAATNAISNPSFEDPINSGNNATDWTTDKTGTNNATFTRTNVAADVHSGTNAAEVSITNFTSGDAKWLPTSTTTSAGKDYIFTAWYKSSTTTQVGYFANDGFHWLKDLGPASAWTEYQVEIFIPTGVTSIQVTQLLFSVGTLITDDYSLIEQASPALATGGHVTLSFDDGWKTFNDYAFPILASSSLKSTAYIISQANQTDPADYMDNATIQSLFTSGIVEIGAHTRNHLDLVKDDPVAFNYADRPAMWQSEINGSLADLKALLPSATIDTFAYPYGSYDSNVEASVLAAGFIGARSVDQGYNTSATDKFALKQQHITNTTTFAEAKGWIDYAIANKVWLIMMFHDVWPTIGQCVDRAAPDVADPDCTDTSTLQQIATYLKTQETAVPGTVVTVHEGLGLMSSAPVPDTIPPSIAAHANVTATTTSASGTTVTYTLPVVTDNISTGLVATCTPVSGSLFALGSTTVTCTAADTATPSNHATSTFVVNVSASVPVNAAPVAANQSVSTTKNIALPIALTATDSDSATLTFATTSNPAHGTISGTGATLTYTPTTDYVGSDLFTFTASDGTSTSNTATISITVNATPNNTPVATAQSVSLEKNASASITLAGTDTDNDTLTFATSSNPAHGTLSGTGSILTYTPATDYTGSDSFTFVAHDATSTSAAATVSITVNAPAPVTPPSNGGGNGGGSSGGGGGGIVGSGPLSIGYINGGNNSGGGLVLGAQTQALTEQQINSILDLLRSFNADQSVIDSVSKALHGQSTRFTFTFAFQLGARGNQVTELQKILIAKGFLKISATTGVFGPATKAAVIAFQKAHGLPQTGVVGKLTIAVLNSQ
jgi:peptidoglycan/xylan/chitin deacetylase (PgdA/CDA1 family)